MDIKKMLEGQKKLDAIMMKESGFTDYPRNAVKTAYRVELGEALQEWKEFKYWKKTKGKADRERLLEELADCLHFALSLRNDTMGDLEPNMLNELMRIERSPKEVKDVFIYENIEVCFRVEAGVLRHTIALGLRMGYTLKELEEAYWKKNKINYERVSSGY